jgi:spermidine synthase
MAEKRWIAETLFDDLGFRMSYRMEKVLYETQTEHQHLVLFEHGFFGKMLMLDGATQITKRDEFIYQEMMSHVPLFAHGKAREVLIIGGGDCGIAEEVLKHKTVRRLTQVEIDPAVVEFAKEHFPEFTKPVFADKRFASVIDDGMKYVARTCKSCMQKGGVMVTQNGVPIFQPAELASSIGKFRRLFADGACYVAAIPTYVGGHMAMGWASDDRQLRQTPAKTLAARYRRAGSFSTKYWTPEVHAAAFALPRFIAEMVAKAKA